MGLCRLCLTYKDEVIHIFSDNGRALEIPAIISQYFWFQITDTDSISTMICRGCWTSTTAFHMFRDSVKKAQENYFQHSSFVEFNQKSYPSSSTTTTIHIGDTIKTNNIPNFDVAIKREPFQTNEHPQQQQQQPPPPLAPPPPPPPIDFQSVTIAEVSQQLIPDKIVTDLKSAYNNGSVKVEPATYRIPDGSQIRYIPTTVAVDGTSHSPSKIKVDNEDTSSEHESDKTPSKEQQNDNEPHTLDSVIATVSISKPTKASTSGHKHACDYCGKEFRTKPCMEAHRLEIHLGVVVPKVPCTICGTWLKNKNALYQHTRNIHGERKHQCSICQKAFTKAISLKEHMSLHTGVRLYTCTHCPKTFKWSCKMYSHRKKAHFGELAATASNKAR